MDRGRWYPTATVMADGNILIVGGMQQVSKNLLCHDLHSSSCLSLLNSALYTTPTATGSVQIVPRVQPASKRSVWHQLLP